MHQEEVKAVHREPHPFISTNYIKEFVGKPVAFVGQVLRVEDNVLILKSADSKLITDKRIAIMKKSSWLLQNCAKEEAMSLNEAM